VLLAACASAPPPPAPVPDAPVPAPARTSAADPAWLGLLERARTARIDGDTASALALIERAQRIAPAAGVVYLELARTHLAAGDRRQAQASAARGLLYCSGSECEALEALAR
jgi:hypothetical protein